MAKENVKALCLRFDLDDEEELKAYDTEPTFSSNMVV